MRNTKTPQLARQASTAAASYSPGTHGKMKPVTKQTVLMSVLIAVVIVTALTMALLGKASRLEAVSFVTGAICVWMTVTQNVWNFPIGLINVATFSVVFFQSRLFADAGLQVVYFVLGVIGWYLWLHGGENRSALQVSRASPLELTCVLLFMVTATVGLRMILHQFGGSASFWDALTTSLSLGSQWLLNRKRLENWIGWIIVDVIYIPLYLYKHLYLTALLYAIFLVMATMGLRAWWVAWRKPRDAFASDPVLGEPLL